MSYTTEGTIETIFDEETHGNNGFKKRVIWLKNRRTIFANARNSIHAIQRRFIRRIS